MPKDQSQESHTAPAVQDGQQCDRIKEVLSRVGDRWSVMIIFSLGRGTMRFNEMKRYLGISQRMLSLTLKALERDGLVQRTLHPTVPPRVDYDLTDLGRSFCEPVYAMGRWALDNLDNIDRSRAAYDDAQED